MSSNEKNRIRVKFHVPDDHKLHFATSVWGGINAKGMVEINFLHDRPAIPEVSVDHLDENGNVIKSEADYSGYDFVRVVQTGVVMDIDSARSFLKWLQDKIEAWDLRKKNAGAI